MMGRIAGLLPAVLLAACATGETTLPASPPPAAAAFPEPDFGVEIGALPAQRLEPGTCGLFLWSKAPRRRLVFFSDSAEPAARMVLDGRESALVRTAVDGDPAVQRVVRQSFEIDGRRVTLEFEVEPRPGLVDGAVIPRGALRLEDRAGREMVLPVGGLIACAAN